jgi:hypothetical protein
MNPYDDPPSCRRCGGYLGSAGEMCACGGVSQYRESRSVLRAVEEAAEERRGLSWEEAMAQLWRRYVP